jgi:hypothetical protein
MGSVVVVFIASFALLLILPVVPSSAIDACTDIGASMVE